MKIVVGTYEGSLLGWESDAQDRHSLRLAYAFNAFDTTVKAIAVDTLSSNTLVTGGHDESIRIYSLKSHREQGVLLEHKASITALQFYGAASLVSGSSDGRLCIWRVSDWTCLDNIRAHT